MIKESLIDIEPKHLVILKKIFKLYIPSKTVWAYGSRVTWTANTKSDLDIIVFDVNSKQINNLKDALAESDLPFSVDVMNWEKIPETFKENIQKKYVVLQDKADLDDWKEYKLGEVVTFQRGHDLPRTSMKSGGFPVAGSNGIIGFHNEATTKGPGVTIGRSGNIGIPKFYSTDFWAHNTVLYIKDFNSNNEKFVFYFLHSFDFTIFNAGSAVPTLNRNHIHEIPVIIPPLSEQRSIASVLSSLDDKIDLLHRQNETLEAMAEALFRQWFVEPCKDRLPEGWEEGKLGDVVEVIDNRGKTPPIENFKTNFPLIEVNALNSDSCLVNYSVIKKYVSKETFENWFRAHLQVNDIIISTVGTIGVFSIHLNDRGCIAQNLVGLRSSILSGYYLYNFFKSNIDLLLNLDIGGVQPSIKVPHLLDMSVNLPLDTLLIEFDNITKDFFRKIAQNQTQIRTLEKLRDTLLPKLMSGEVRVKPIGMEVK